MALELKVTLFSMAELYDRPGRSRNTVGASPTVLRIRALNYFALTSATASSSAVWSISWGGSFM